MRRIIILTLAVLLLLAVAVPAMADNEAWEPDKQSQILINRCSNAGAGNGGELGVFFISYSHEVHLVKACVDKFLGHEITIGEEFFVGPIWVFIGFLVGVDLDPGNSFDNNNAPDAPPGQMD